MKESLKNVMLMAEALLTVEILKITLVSWKVYVKSWNEANSSCFCLQVNCTAKTQNAYTLPKRIAV